ncbi:MAG: nucleoside phosphorylase [Oscillospiraceae bacterium]
MSLFDTFDPDSEEIVKFEYQRSFNPTDAFPETVIMTFKDKTFHALEHVCPTQVVATLREGVDIPVYKLDWNGRSIGIFRTLIGGAGTAGLLEEALAMGAKKVLLYGSCGVLDSALTAGHFILPTQSYRDEGTSYHYLPVSDYVDIPTSARLGEIFDELNLPYVKGRVWTTDAFYRETRNNMAKRKADGCIAVDMECASAMAVGQFRGAEVYQFLYAEDSLDGDAWDRRTMGAVPTSSYEKYLRVALEAASRL